jgi:hypothetical protein
MPASKKPQETKADVLQREALNLLAPLVRLLIANGVAYPQFAQALKRVFLDAARAELDASHTRVTDSALSLLSGVHRKDVRSLASAEEMPAASVRALSFATQVFTRWIHDPAYRDELGQPRVLPLRTRDEASASFDKLVQAVSKDFHARSVLDELVRLRLVEIRGNHARVVAEAFVPAEGVAEAAYYVSANVRDHLAASSANLTHIMEHEKPPFLEHAVFADAISDRSAAELQTLARRLWTATVNRMVEAATRFVAQDADLPQEKRASRVRFGAFFYSEPAARPATLSGVDDT